jgi:hypothetical protein
MPDPGFLRVLRDNGNFYIRITTPEVLNDGCNSRFITEVAVSGGWA